MMDSNNTILPLDQGMMDSNNTILPLDQGMMDSNNTILPLDTGSETWRYVLLTWALLLMIVGVIGNGMTLVAFSYTRWNYPRMFDMIHTSVAELLINLSTCDLLYCLLGLSHYLHVLASGGYPYQGWTYGETICEWQGFFLYVIALVDFNTMGLIAVFICSYHLCSKCDKLGSLSEHEEHRSLLFWRHRVILGTWVVTFCIVMAATEDYRWTGTVYGCAAVSDASNWSYDVVIFLNLLVMAVCYMLVLVKVCRRIGTEPWPGAASKTLKDVKSQLVMPVLLAGTYAVCVLPATLYCWGFIRVSTGQENIKNVVTMLYWCMYAVNFTLYILTSERMRAMYVQCLADLWSYIKNIHKTKGSQEKASSSSSSSA